MELKKYLNSNLLKTIFKVLLIFIISSILSYAFYQLNFKEETILMIYLTGVLVIVIESGSYIYGFVSSLIYIFTYNFFFVQPYHTFRIAEINNVISLVIFFIVSFIAGILASKLKQQIKLTAQLEKAKAEIEKEKTRSMLLRSISHDLRTPLTAIAGSSNFLSENYDVVSKEDAITLLKDVENDARSLTNMIENLLNMTRIQDGRLIIEKKQEVLDDIISQAINRVVKKDMMNKVVIEEDSQIVSCPVDDRLIVQVFSNLIDNAFKHNLNDCLIKIKVQLIEENAVITFCDNGKGVPLELKEKIFETFYTGSSKADTGRGLGLGLPICKTIINAHGGKINVYNNKEGGACFEVVLPGAKL